MILVSRLYNGGAEKVAAIIANEISKKYNLVLVTIEDKNENDYECTATRIVLKENQGKFLVKKNLVKQIRKIKEKYNITHTISLCSKMNYFNVMSKVNDVNIISIRNYLSVSVKEKKYQHINKVSAKYADKIIVVSKQLIEDQVKNFKADKGKIHVIYNYIDEERIDECLIDANIDKNE
ncbi:MAG: glycosyltransferase, partial [Clostridia bacterium]|nr:glycosyltransferase [Clostridia bacterium]